MHKAQVVSCDTYFYVLSYRMGIEKMNDWMRQFGFSEKTGVDLPSESTGLYPNPDWKMRTRKAKWMKGETISVSIGQVRIHLDTIAISNGHRHHRQQRI